MNLNSILRGSDERLRAHTGLTRSEEPNEFMHTTAASSRFGKTRIGTSMAAAYEDWRSKRREM